MFRINVVRKCDFIYVTKFFDVTRYLPSLLLHEFNCISIHIGRTAKYYALTRSMIQNPESIVNLVLQ